MKKLVTVLALMTVLVSALCFPAAAEGTGKSYVYDNYGNAMAIPDPYSVKESITDLNLNLAYDMVVQGDYLYILDRTPIAGMDNTYQAHIVVLNRDYELVRELTFTQDDAPFQFKDPRGIWVDEYGTIYIADRGPGDTAGQVVLATNDGVVTKVFGKPDSELMSQSSSQYYPVKVLTDDLGIIYIMVENEYRGIVTLDQNGEFQGYFGSNNVTLTGDVLMTLFWRNFMTEDQIARMQQILPTEYTNFTIDDDGFIYCSRGATNDMNELIRKINCKSKNVLQYTERFGDVGLTSVRGQTQKTRFAAITVDDKGFITTLDTTWNRLFQYTSEGEIMYIFGGQGQQNGTFQSPVDVDSWGDDLIVLDQAYGTVTVLEPTTFAQNVREGQYLYSKGDYQASLEPWYAVTDECMNYLFGYKGIGQALYMQKDYVGAMENYNLAGDYENYSAAFQLYRTEAMQDMFTPILIVVVTLVVLWAVYKILKRVGVLKSRKLVLDESGKIKYVFHTLFHPIEGYQEMRYNKKYSMAIALVLIFLYFLTDVISYLNGGFIFVDNTDLSRYNIVITFVMDVGVIALFALANWLMSTFFEGKGRLKETWIYLCYATLPVTFYNLLYVLLSNVLTLEEGVFLTYISIIFQGWMIIMMIFALQGLHMYSFKRNILSIICTILAMLVVLFIVFLMFNLFIQFFSFIETVVKEVMYRMVVGF